MDKSNEISNALLIILSVFAFIEKTDDPCILLDDREYMEIINECLESELIKTFNIDIQLKNSIISDLMEKKSNRIKSVLSIEDLKNNWQEYVYPVFEEYINKFNRWPKLITLSLSCLVFQSEEENKIRELTESEFCGGKLKSYNNIVLKISSQIEELKKQKNVTETYKKLYSQK